MVVTREGARRRLWQHEAVGAGSAVIEQDRELPVQGARGGPGARGPEVSARMG